MFGTVLWDELLSEEDVLLLEELVPIGIPEEVPWPVQGGLEDWRRRARGFDLLFFRLGMAELDSDAWARGAAEVEEPLQDDDFPDTDALSTVRSRSLVVDGATSWAEDERGESLDDTNDSVDSWAGISSEAWWGAGTPGSPLDGSLQKHQQIYCFNREYEPKTEDGIIDDSATVILVLRIFRGQCPKPLVGYRVSTWSRYQNEGEVPELITNMDTETDEVVHVLLHSRAINLRSTDHLRSTDDLRSTERHTVVVHAWMST